MSLSTKIVKEFQKIGQAAAQMGINTSHSGNISMRQGKTIYITRRGSMKGFLTSKDIITVGLKPSAKDSLASTEVIVHRSIYLNTNAKVVVHTHPPIATAFSFREKEIKPIDLEGSLLLPRVPVIECLKPTASKELASKLSLMLKKSPAVLIKRHGLFCIGQTLEDAFHYTSLTEHAAKIIYFRHK
ncbi:MAG: class II aldolase/adducin family protein [Planctomycetota bacterium]